MRDSTMMYRTQIDALRGLPAEQFKTAVLAIWDYELDGKEPDDPIASFAVGMAKPLIDKRTAKYENGKKGGRPKAKPNEQNEKPSANQVQTYQNVKDKEERIKDKELNNNIPASEYPYKEVIAYLNEKAGTRFLDKSKDTRSHIKARFDEGFTLDDFKRVIDGRCEAWKGDPKMEEFLRPRTLFGTKFEGYLNAKASKPKPKRNGFNNFTQREYDYGDLERMLTGVGS